MLAQGCLYSINIILANFGGFPMKCDRMKVFATNILLSLSLLSFSADAQQNSRKDISIPDIRGYFTMKCDFHTHSVFSDGSVWPSVRPQEAWLEGLDALAMTDHIEYLPHKSDILTDHNRPYEIAGSSADTYEVMLVHGVEVTRSEPFGHYNAIFITDGNALDQPDSLAALAEAKDQGGFLFWNHPGWKQPDGKAVWTDVQDNVYEKGLINGIEVINGESYYPNAHRWCIEKNLTMMCSTDVHSPINQAYDVVDGHRPMTLVFSKKRSIEGIKEALFDRRTALYWHNMLIGDEKFLAPIFNESIEILTPEVTITGTGRAYVQIRNDSDVSFVLEAVPSADGSVLPVTQPSSLRIEAHRTIRFGVNGVSADQSGKKKVLMQYRVTNLLVAPDQYLEVVLPLKVTMVKASAS